ncbi:Bcr/CflA family drug resistance efflux transporter [Marinomonas piezotolerans]|uniref:Bcr/CflA family efflux transporter n=1 Tax=Marinomonas piezotolerans TaxID=2213058 RepID=A0A370UCR1_9GAMM|nr:multidrug effflux MFS transporter [Marinomonas piezotolerans]RDL45539.1 Bcr/CflA family drug resistance efflux transporter [Marinomonas piezotolerans]
MSATHSRWLVPLLGYLVAFGPLSIDMYLPSLPIIAADLNSNQQIVQYSITAFLVGMTVGMLLFGPLSDQLGRKKLLLAGTLLYALTSLGCAFAQSGESLIAYRAFQSIGAAAAAVLARALVRDYFAPKQAAGILSTMHIISMIVMLFAPLLGAYIVEIFDWRWIFYLLAAFSVIAFLAISIIIKEPQNNVTQAPTMKAYFSSYAACLKEPRVSLLILTNGFSFAGMFAFIAASAFVYIEHFGYSESTYGLLFSANIGAIIVMTLINKQILLRYSSEHALRFALVVSIVATLCMSIAGLASPALAALFMLPCMLYISVTGSIGANCLATLFNIIPNRAGTAAGLLVALQFALGAFSTYITSLLFDGTPNSLLLIMAGFGVLTFLSYIASTRHRT